MHSCRAFQHNILHFWILVFFLSYPSSYAKRTFLSPASVRAIRRPQLANFKAVHLANRNELDDLEKSLKKTPFEEWKGIFYLTTEQRERKDISRQILKLLRQDLRALQQAIKEEKIILSFVEAEEADAEAITSLQEVLKEYQQMETVLQSAIEHYRSSAGEVATQHQRLVRNLALVSIFFCLIFIGVSILHFRTKPELPFYAQTPLCDTKDGIISNRFG